MTKNYDKEFEIVLNNFLNWNLKDFRDQLKKFSKIKLLDFIIWYSWERNLQANENILLHTLIDIKKQFDIME